MLTSIDPTDPNVRYAGTQIPMQPISSPEILFQIDEDNQHSFRPFYYPYLLDTNHLGDSLVDQHMWDDLNEPVLKAIENRSLGRHFRALDHHFLTIIDQIRERQRRLGKPFPPSPVLDRNVNWSSQPLRFSAALAIPMPEVPIRAFPLPPITPFSDTKPVMIQGKPCLFDESALLFLEVKPSDFSLTGVTKPTPRRKESSKKRKGKDKAKGKEKGTDKGRSIPSTTQASYGNNEADTLIKLLDDPLSLKSGLSADFPISLETWIKRKDIVLSLLQGRRDGKIKFTVSDVSLTMAIWDIQERSGTTPMAELTDLVRQVICKYTEKNQYVLNAGTFRIPGQTDAQFALRRLDPFLNLLALHKWCAEATLHPDWKVLFIDYGERSAMLVPPSGSERKKR